jgi:AraC-like DNA-binding protein
MIEREGFARSLILDRTKATSPPPSLGLDGIAVKNLLGGAVLKGHDPAQLIEAAGIDPSVYGNANAAIDGRAYFRLIQQIQIALDDAFIGFLAEGCRLALEKERTRSYLHCATLGEALRVSIRFTQALSADIGPRLVEDGHFGVKHVCSYQTIAGLDRDIFVWFRFVWIYHLFSWLIGRPLRLRKVFLQGRRPTQTNDFERFALFHAPVEFDAPFDALLYDRKDLHVNLVHGSLAEYEAYNADIPDWFATPSGALTWRGRTEQALIQSQRYGDWSPPIDDVAHRLRSNPRRLRRDLACEGESFQQIRMRLRGELAGAFLLATDIAITVIGYKLGFIEPGSFTRNFMGWSGMTPSEYRHRYRSDANRVAVATTLLTERSGQQ